MPLDHGRPSTYNDRGCRCDDCSLAWTRKNKRYLARAHQHGGRTTVPTDEFIEPLTALTATMSRRAIGSAIGASDGYIARILAGDIRNISVERALAIRKLLARPVDAGSLGALFVTAAPSTRRLRALTALGYSQYKLVAETGLARNTLWPILYGRVPMIHSRTHGQIRDTYDRISMTLPVAANKQEASGITRARNTARRNGWGPPLSYDDIDAPDAQPDIGEVKHDRRGRPMVRDLIIENAEWMADADETLATVCSRLDLTREYFYQACLRAKRTDLFAKLARRDPTGEISAAVRTAKRGAA